MNKIRLDNKDFYYQVFYKKIKNMYLRVDSDGILTITCNSKISNARIETFIQDNQTRIIRKINEKNNRISLYFDDVFLYFGKEMPMQINKDMGKTGYEIDSEKVTINLKLPASTNKVIEKIYDELLLKKIEDVLERRKDEIGQIIDFKKLIFKTQLMHSRFGSCIPQKKVIKLNTILGRFPEIYTEAILLHELVHLVVPHHQKDFYKTLETLMPEYRKIRGDLNKLSRKYVF